MSAVILPDEFKLTPSVAIPVVPAKNPSLLNCKAPVLPPTVTPAEINALPFPPQ